MEIVKSSANRWYVKDYDKVVSDIPHTIVNMIANQCGRYSLTKSSYITFDNESDCKLFGDIVDRINNIPKELKTFLKKEKVYELFVLNFPKGSGETLTNAFLWETSNEGHEYWFNLNKKYNENQLQNKDIDRSRDNRSERNRLRCGGDIVESSTRYSGYEARARKSKNALRSHKVYLSSRCGCVHRG